MKKIIKYSNYFGFILALCVMILSGCSCSAPKPPPDPLAGWQLEFKEQPNQAIISDYQNYIQQLPPQERQLATVDEWLKDGTGQHAIKITVGINHTNWRHILIYDKDNKRIKTIKYADGNSMS